MMRKRIILAGILACIMVVSISLVYAAVTNGKMNVNVGDEIYVCGCGEGCNCDAMSSKPATCSCGKDMIKTKVKKVDDNFIYVEARDKGFKRVGKYACACGSDCKCDTISQKPGKCACGADLKEVKPN
jgi:hypothetical protein